MFVEMIADDTTEMKFARSSLGSNNLQPYSVMSPLTTNTRIYNQFGVEERLKDTFTNTIRSG